MLRFHLDEHVSHAIASGLKQRQIDVTTTTEAGLIGAADLDHLAYALREQGVLFTNDADFLRIASRGVEHAGIVYCPPETRQVGEIVRLLALMHDCFGPDETHNHIEYL